MSRIGKKEINIPAGVTIEIKGKSFRAKGLLGEDGVELLPGLGLSQDGSILRVTVKEGETDKKIIAYHGLFRSLINNIIIGVSSGFEKQLEIVGVGYRATQQNKAVQFQLGYSHDVVFNAPEGISLEVLDSTNVKVKGINKQNVGQVAADIRELRPPEPYKGKGIRYKNEYIRKKAGKAGA